MQASSEHYWGKPAAYDRRVRYGWKHNPGSGPPVIEDSYERATIKLIIELHGDGESRRSIARSLEQMHIHPRQGQGHGWDHTVIGSILRREGVSRDTAPSVTTPSR